MKTRKNKLINLLKTGILFFGILVLLWNCEKENHLEDNQIQLANINANKVDIKNITIVNNFLKGKFKSKVQAKSSINSNAIITPLGTIPLENISEVIDSIGNANYTFPIIPKTYFHNKFYNLIINKTNENNISSYILEYNMSDEFAKDYKSGIKDLFEFSGSIKKYAINDFLNLKSKSSSNCTEDLNNSSGGFNFDSPCLETNLNNGSPSSGGASSGGTSGGGSGGGGSSGGNTGGIGFGGIPTNDTASCSLSEVYVTDCGGSSSNKMHTYSSCGGPSKNNATYYYEWTCTDGSSVLYSKGENDCDTSSGTLAIAPVPFYKFTNAFLNLSLADSNFLDNNCDLKNNLYDFLNNNVIEGDYSNTALNFSEKIIKILNNNNISEAEKFIQYQIAYNSFDPILPDNTIQEDYETKIRKYATSFKQWGNKEFGNYLDSLLPLDSSFSDQDYRKLYETIRKKAGDLFWDYIKAIVGQTFESFKPVIEMALWEVGGGVALKVLSKLPIKYLTTPIKNVIARLKAPTSNAFSNLKHAKKYGIQSYKQLAKEFEQLGLKLSKEGVERHHLIEVRFFKENPNIRAQLQNKFGAKTDDWLCIIVEKTKKLTQSEHYVLSQKWLKAIGKKNQKPGTTGFNSDNVPFNVIIEQARKIYKDYPEILNALGI